MTLFVLYAVAASPAFIMDGFRVIIYPATHDAAEVYLQPVEPVLVRSFVGIEPYNLAAEVADKRAAANPHDLAPPYILHDPYRLVAPYITPRGRQLAAAPIFSIVPETPRARHSLAQLEGLMNAEHGPMEVEPDLFAMSVEPELNRVVVETNVLDQGMRRRLARTYGDLVTIHWDPNAEPAILL